MSLNFSLDITRSQIKLANQGDLPESRSAGNVLMRLDPDGNLLIVDYSSLRLINATTGIIDTILRKPSI